MIVDERSLGCRFEVGVTGDQNTAIWLLFDTATDVDVLSIFALNHLGSIEGTLVVAEKQKQLAGPRAGENVEVTIVVEVH